LNNVENTHFLGSRDLYLTQPYMYGADIKVLQELLSLLPDHIVPGRLKPDGILDPHTRNAIRNFQQYFGIEINGVADANTFYALGQPSGRYALNQTVFASRTLKVGSQGFDVFILQNRLAAYRKTSLNHTATSFFDKGTEDAVKRLQLDFSDLTADGICDSKTFAKIFALMPLGGRILKLSSYGFDTYYLQVFLWQLGYYSHSLHGFFDSATEQALKSFQEDAGLKVNGIADPETLLALGTSISFPQNNYLYRVQKGDSIYKIALLFNKDVNAITQINNIDPAQENINSGQLLKIPVPLNFYLIEKGDTLESIAAHYNINANLVHKANNLMPVSDLIPGETLVLPGYKQDLTGNLITLSQNDQQHTINIINLDKQEITLLDMVSKPNTPKLFMSKDYNIVSILVNMGNTLINYDMAAGLSWRLNLSETTEFIDWSYDNEKIVTANGIVIDAINGRELFTFAGNNPRWLNDNQNLIYFNNDNSFRKLNIETGEEEELFALEDEFTWSYSLNDDNTKLLIICLIPPGRVTVTYVYDLLNNKLSDINENDFFGEWSRTGNLIFLCTRDYFGEFPPHFYKEVTLCNSEGRFITQEFYGKGLDLLTHNFSSEDLYFACILYNPGVFYPVPSVSRDLYIKHTRTRLLTRVTQDQHLLDAVWL